MYIYLDFITQFACEMCGTCCQNDWQVTIDEASYHHNAQWFAESGQQAEFAQAFTLLVPPNGPGEFAAIAKKDGRCWFLETSNLCQLHREVGHEQLDSVCQTYPRYPIDTARGVELTLSFSCPAVLKLAHRPEPLTIIRSEQPPFAFRVDACVAQVYPGQQSENSPLRYYFEIEQHIVDILQCRSLPMKDRLEFLATAVQAINHLERNESFGSKLRSLVYQNYDVMDAQTNASDVRDRAISPLVTPDILIEHFLVNLVFKKIGYLYGLERMATILQQVWCHIDASRCQAVDCNDELERVKGAIIEMELQYSHNRKALIK